MHLHDNRARPEVETPLHCRSGEVFTLDDGRAVALETLIAAILHAPEDFEQTEIRLLDLEEQIRGRSKLNFHHVASMSRRNARRPLLLAREASGALLLIDGRHRAARSKQLGYEMSPAIVLSPTQWAALAR